MEKEANIQLLTIKDIINYQGSKYVNDLMKKKPLKSVKLEEK